jgi:hypothetical protein
VFCTNQACLWWLFSFGWCFAPTKPAFGGYFPLAGVLHQAILPTLDVFSFCPLNSLRLPLPYSMLKLS